MINLRYGVMFDSLNLTVCIGALLFLVCDSKIPFCLCWPMFSSWVREVQKKQLGGSGA